MEIYRIVLFHPKAIVKPCVYCLKCVVSHLDTWFWIDGSETPSDNAKVEPFSKNWREKPSETNNAAVNFYALNSVEKLQSQLEKEAQLGVELLKKIMALRRGKQPVLITAQH